MSLVRRPVLSAARLGATGLRTHLSTSPVHHLRVAAVQLRERPTVSATVARISDLLGKAARNDAQVALFPEAALTGYGPEAVERTSAEDVIAAEEDVRAACRRYSIGAIVGTPRDGFNSALVIGADGSELCRQIVRQRPRLLVALDVSEFALFQIQRELKRICADEGLQAPVVAVLGSVTNRALVSRTLETYHVETLYHAAAYKHVELVEHNVIQGIMNNTFGTLYTAQAAVEAGVRNFILISTDKAVRTTNIMGASKRLAEMLLQALQEEAATTRFSVVRFGNVLGSSGSVVPLFLEQIDRGGPVTVTHSDVTRYFMTITEAAGLVLQASSLSRGGDLFLLDMGQPIKILELARRMIHLKGYTVRDEHHPSGDIAIEITGLKPGEKLHEELLVGDRVAGTEHRKILRAEEAFLPWAEMRGALATLEQACAGYDYDAIKTFIEGLVEGADLAAQLGGLYRSAEVIALKPATEDQKGPR